MDPEKKLQSLESMMFQQLLPENARCLCTVKNNLKHRAFSGSNCWNIIDSRDCSFFS
jgi:hypothetical protein